MVAVTLLLVGQDLDVWKSLANVCHVFDVTIVLGSDTSQRCTGLGQFLKLCKDQLEILSGVIVN